MILRVTTDQLTLLKKEARDSQPTEACALLFGRIGEREVAVERVVMTANVLKSPVRFEIDSEAFYTAFTEAVRDGLEFVGFFHSHPAPATPSSVDLEFMRLWEAAVWLIFSLTDDTFAAFQMKKGRVYSLVLKNRGKT